MSVHSEAEAFDQIIEERVLNGHIPDLRAESNCDYFYNNPWRRPYLTKMYFKDRIDFGLRNLKNKSILEVGCGPGYLALEFARYGFNVTGIDISEKAIEVARDTASKNTFTENFGSLEYFVQDFLEWDTDKKFDNVCFYGVLHHFTPEEIDKIAQKVKSVLYTGGRLIIAEPSRDLLTEREAYLITLIRMLLSAYDAWYQKLDTPKSPEKLKEYIYECLNEYKEQRDSGGDVQSPHDNLSYSKDILRVLSKTFTEVEYGQGFSFIHRICGGVRAKSEELTQEINEFLFLIDKAMVDSGIINPSGFDWAGELK